jgi:hypothetical protein
MAEVITFVNFRPPARYDNLPWTGVAIEESVDSLDPWTQIDVIAFTSVDVDPTHPQLRNFTTEHGTALDYWYRILFRDGTGDVSQPTTPVQNLAGSTVTADVYATTDELFRILKIRSPTPDQAAAADRCLQAAAGEINSKMGRLDALEPWQLQLCAEVNLERAVEHWQQQEVPFGVIGLDSPSGPTYLPRKSRALAKLLPAQQSWGVA